MNILLLPGVKGGNNMDDSKKKVVDIEKHPKTIKFKDMNSLIEERTRKRNEKYNRFMSECEAALNNIKE